MNLVEKVYQRYHGKFFKEDHKNYQINSTRLPKFYFRISWNGGLLREGSLCTIDASRAGSRYKKYRRPTESEQAILNVDAIRLAKGRARRYGWCQLFLPFSTRPILVKKAKLSLEDIAAIVYPSSIRDARVINL